MPMHPLLLVGLFAGLAALGTMLLEPEKKPEKKPADPKPKEDGAPVVNVIVEGDKKVKKAKKKPASADDVDDIEELPKAD